MKLPKARRKGLVVHEFADEVVIYDLESNQAHCLNQASGFVWRRCDGRTSVAKLTKMLGDQMQTNVNEEVVWLALDQLASYDLLQEYIFTIRDDQNLPSTSRPDIGNCSATGAACDFDCRTYCRSGRNLPATGFCMFGRWRLLFI
jgi:hypothetical protein